MSAKEILLVCWDFPPNDGIGGRRWAKFAKGMVKEGYTIHVIKSKTPVRNTVSPWFKDVDHPGLRIYELKPYWAATWLHDYKSTLHSVRIRIARLWLSLAFKGTIYDKAIGRQDQFLALARKIIKANSIKNILVTGAPFNLIYYASLLKSDLPGLNIIADYRDPWINSVNYGMTILSSKQMQQEKDKQALVFEKVDTITAPNEFLIEQIKETYAGKKTQVKFMALPHIYDPDDVVRSLEKPKSKAHLKLVYAGALYTDSDPFLTRLADALVHFKSQQPAVKVELDIYTTHSTKAFLNKGLEQNVNFLSPLGDKIFETISRYDLLIILLSEHNKDFKTTKFIEFLPYKIPYLYVGPKGFVSESILNDELGYILTAKNDLLTVYDILHASEPLKGFEAIDEHSLEQVTKKIINCFN